MTILMMIKLSTPCESVVEIESVSQTTISIHSVSSHINRALQQTNGKFATNNPLCLMTILYS